MRTARQPTILTWFVFAVLFAIPLALPYAKLDSDLLEANGPPSMKVAFALGSSAPLILAALLGLVLRSYIWIAVLCIQLRTAWFVLVIYLEFNALFSPAVLTGFSASVWPEWWTILILKSRDLLDDPVWIPLLLISLLCSILYAMIALLLTATCRLRDKQF
jgi:hypothetical protein